MATDQIFDTGINSRSMAKTLRTTVNEENVKKQAQLRPSAKIIFEEIEKLKAEELDIKTIILEGQTEEDIKLELAVRKRTYNKLIKLQTRFNTILKAESKNDRR